jgi:RimJ/RimL family protein N-acetyltransferase
MTAPSLPARDLPTMLAGPRIILRRLEDADAEAVHETTLAARAHLAPWLHWPQHHRTIEETRTAIRDDRLRWLQRDRVSMGIFARADGAFLGSMAIEVEEPRIPAFNLAYWIRPDLEGQGYVSEAARLVIACAFERLHARRVAIYCDPRNARSARVAERLGFAFEGHLRQDALTPDGEVRDTLVFALIPEDYERVRAAWG